jgi:hypothetical protein
LTVGEEFTGRGEFFPCSQTQTKETKKMTQQAAAQVLPFEPKKPAPTFGAMLGATKTTEATTPKKGKMPTLEAPPEVKTAIDDYQEAKAQEKQAKAVMEITGAVIAGFVRARQDADGYAGKFSGSYAVMGNRDKAKVIYANKYSLSPEDEAQLAEILGPNFPAMISRRFTVKLKDEVFESEEKQAELMQLIGARFPEFFETKVSLAVCEGFSKLVYKVLKPEDLENLRVYARQYSPSIR